MQHSLFISSAVALKDNHTTFNATGVCMQIQVNTDHNIDGKESTAQWVESIVEKALSRHSDQITRVEVHISDENGSKAGTRAMRCKMEARLEHRQPTTVTSNADTVDAAVRDAAEKLHRAIDSVIGKLHA
ncbi:MAG: HPF/RaiA family ribosome-associated protein [Gemmatimonadaceae bacterium]